MPSVSRFDMRGGISRSRRQLENQVLFLKNARPQSDGTEVVRGGQTLYKDIGNASVGSIETVFGRYTSAFGLHIYSVKREDGINDTIYDNETELTGLNFGAGAFTSVGFYRDAIFFSNGITPINYHLSNTENTVRMEVSGSPNPPLGQHMIFYKDRCYIGSSDGNVSWSNAGMFSTLPTVDFPETNFQVLGGAGDGITALVVGQDFLLAATRSRYFVMTGVPGDDGDAGDMNWQTFIGIGILYPRNVTATKRGILIFGSDKRLYFLESGVLTDLDVSDYVAEYLQGVNSNLLQYVSLIHLGDELWMYMPKSQNINVGRILVRSEQKHWTVFEDINGYAYGNVVEVNRLFVGSASGGHLWEQDSEVGDLGASISFETQSRQEALGSFRKKKAYTLFSAQADIAAGESLSFSYAIDGSEVFTNFSTGTPLTNVGKTWGEEIWGLSAWGGFSLKTAILRFASGIRVRAQEIRLKVTGNVRAGTRFLGYELEGDLEERDDINI